MTFNHIPKPLFQFNYKWSSTLANRHPIKGHDDINLWTFKPSFTHGLQGKPIDQLYDILYPSVSNRGKKSTRQALMSAVLTLSQVVSWGIQDRLNGFIHGRSTHHKKPLNRYKTNDFSPTTFTNVLDTLKPIGFVTDELGIKGENYFQGISTLWFPANTFRAWLHKHSNELELISFRDTQEAIRLKTNEKKGKLKDYTDTSITRAMRQRVESSNNLRCQFKWSHMMLEDKRQFVEGDQRRIIPDADLRCRRSFKGNFETGGRFYCGAQRLSKHERSTITVNDSATIELDYKSLHLRLLYNLEGLEAPTDCYASDARPRQLSKNIGMYCMNCKSRSGALKALMKEYELTSEIAKLHLETFEKEHALVVHLFYGNGWGNLQYLDSQLVDAVLESATAKGIPVLPVHDSFIVSTEWGFWIKDALAKAYKELTGFDTVIDWDDDPDMFEVLKDIHGGDTKKAAEAERQIEQQALANLKQLPQAWG